MNRTKSKILIVDDHIVTAKGIGRLLKAAGHDTIEVFTGQACIDAIYTMRPDLVLLDVVLPDIDGRDICKKVKTDPTTAHIAVVLLSSVRTESEAQADGLACGADGYIARPVSNNELIARVNAFLRLKRTERRLAEAVDFGEKIFQAAPMGMVSLSLTGRETRMNEAMHAILSALGEDPAGFDFWNSPAWKKSGVCDDARTLLETGQTLHREVQFSPTTGAELWLDCRIARFTHNGEHHLLLTAADITERRAAEEGRKVLLHELQEALADVKRLSGLLPICSSCKNIRDDAGNWRPLEVYIRDHSGAQFTHGICPDCTSKLYPGLFEDDERAPG